MYLFINEEKFEFEYDILPLLEYPLDLGESD